MKWLKKQIRKQNLVILLLVGLIGYNYYLQTKIDTAINATNDAEHEARSAKYYASEAEKKSKSTTIKMVNRLKVPLYDWKIIQDLDIKEIKTHQIVLGNDEDVIGIMSTTNEYITDLREYSDYYNEKTVRNMKPSSLILTSKGIKNGKFQGVNSVTELFSVYHKPTGKKFEMEAVTIKIGDYFYNISYATNEKAKKIISNIEISNP